MSEESILRNLGPIEIQTYQQNRYPLFFVDEIEEAIPGKSAKGFKCFTYNEWFFPAHFEDEPNVPGFIQMETMVQVFLMTFLTLPGNKGYKTAFLSSEVKYKRKIVPGEKLEMVAELESYRRGLAKGTVTGTVKGEFACSAKFVVGIPDVINQFLPSK